MSVLILLSFISLSFAHLPGDWSDTQGNVLTIKLSNSTVTGYYNSQELEGLALHWEGIKHTAFLLHTNSIIWRGVYELGIHDVLTTEIVQNNRTNTCLYKRVRL